MGSKGFRRIGLVSTLKILWETDVVQTTASPLAQRVV